MGWELADAQDRMGVPKLFRAAVANLFRRLVIDVWPQKELRLPFLSVPFHLNALGPAGSSNHNWDGSALERGLEEPARFQRVVRRKEESGVSGAWRRRVGTICKAGDDHCEVQWDDALAGYEPEREGREKVKVSELALADRQMRVSANSGMFFVLEQVIEDYFNKTGDNQSVFDPTGTELVLSFTYILDDLFRFGFYANPAKIEKIADALVTMLDGRFDVASQEGKDGQLLSVNRFERIARQSVNTQSVMDTKKAICRMLEWLDNYKLDFELKVFFGQLERLCLEEMARNQSNLRRAASVRAVQSNVTKVLHQAAYICPGKKSRVAPSELNAHNEPPCGASPGDEAPAGPGWEQTLSSKKAVKALEQLLQASTSKLLDLDNLTTHPGQINLIALDLLQYQDEELVEAGCRLLMTRSRQIGRKLDTIMHSQVVEWSAAPEALQEQLTHRRSSEPSVEHCRAERVLREVTRLINQVQNGLETFEVAVRGTDALKGDLDLLLKLQTEEKETVRMMQQLLHDAGGLQIFAMALQLEVLPRTDETPDEHRMQARGVVCRALKLMINAMSGIESNRKEGVILLDNLLRLGVRLAEWLVKKKAGRSRILRRSIVASDANQDPQDQAARPLSSHMLEGAELRSAPPMWRSVDILAPRGAEEDVEELLQLVLGIVGEVFKRSEHARAEALTEGRVLKVLDILELLPQGQTSRCDELGRDALQVLREGVSPAEGAPVPANQDIVLHALFSHVPLRELLAHPASDPHRWVRPPSAEGWGAGAAELKTMFSLGKERVEQLRVRGLLPLLQGLLDLIAHCCRGSNLAAEVACQPLLPLEDLHRMVSDTDGKENLWVDVELKEVSLRLLHWVYVDVTCRQEALRSDRDVLGIVDKAMKMCDERMAQGDGARLALQTLGPLMCDLFGGYESPEVSATFLKRQLTGMRIVQRAITGTHGGTRPIPTVLKWEVRYMDELERGAGSRRGLEDGELRWDKKRSKRTQQAVKAMWKQVEFVLHTRNAPASSLSVQHAQSAGEALMEAARKLLGVGARQPAQVMETAVREQLDGICRIVNDPQQYIKELRGEKEAPERERQVDAREERGEGIHEEGQDPYKCTLQCGDAIGQLLRFVQGRMRGNQSRESEVAVFVMEVVRRIAVLKRKEMLEAQKRSGRSFRRSEHKEQALKQYQDTQISIAKHGVPRLMHMALLESEQDERLRNAAYLLAIETLQLGNAEVQELFLAEMTKDPEYLLAIQRVLRTGNAALKRALKRNAKHQVRKDDELVNRDLHNVLLWMQLLCEGHHSQMQELFRHQSGSKASVNILAELVQLLATLAKDSSRLVRIAWQLVHQLLNTLTETIQGPCKGNQLFLVDANLQEYCSRILAVREEELEKSADSTDRSMKARVQKGSMTFYFVRSEGGGPDKVDVMETSDAEWHPEARGPFSTLKLDLFACKRAAIRVVQALVEGVTSLRLVRTIRSELDVKLLISMLLGSADNDAAHASRSVAGNFRSRLGSAAEILQQRFLSQDDKTRKRTEQEIAEQQIEVEVLEELYAMLRALDEISAFLERDLSSQVSTLQSKLDRLSQSVGSVEILRHQRVEKYVFRFDPDFTPSIFKTMKRVRVLMEDILAVSRLADPQRRLLELVKGTASTHFELQHLRKIDNFPKVGRLLFELRSHRESISNLAFLLTIILNVIVMFLLEYEELSLSTLQATAPESVFHPDHPHYSHVGVHNVGFKTRDVLIVVAALGLVVVPLHLLGMLEHCIYSLPVNLHRQYSDGGRIPDLGIFHGRIDIGIKSNEADQGVEKEIVNPNTPKLPVSALARALTSWPWLFLVSSVTMVEVVRALLRDWDVITGERFSVWTDYFVFVALGVLLGDILLRLVAMPGHVQEHKEPARDNSPGQSAVSLAGWAELAVAGAWGGLTIVELTSGEDPRVWVSALLWPKLFWATVSFSSALSKLKALLLRGSTNAAGRGAGGPRALKLLLLAWYVLSDVHFCMFCTYVASSLVATLGVLLHLVDGRPFSALLNPLWYALGLIEMIRKLKTLPTVFKAVTMKGKELLQTLALGLYAVYLFGVVAFGLMPHALSLGHDASCTTPLTLVLLNVIFGIIIDAFGQLRDEQEQVAQQLLHSCFICGQERQVFEDPKTDTTFERHIQREHNVWHYVCFIVAISKKRRTELTGTEHFVAAELGQNKLDWLPLNRSLMTDGQLRDTDDGEADETDTNSGNLPGRVEEMEHKMAAMSSKLDLISSSVGELAHRMAPGLASAH